MSGPDRQVTDLIVTEDHLRLDSYVYGQGIGASRNRIKGMIIGGLILVNGNSCKVSQSISVGDHITIKAGDPKPASNVATDIPLDVVFQDEYLLVVNKQAGLPVHPGPGHEADTMVNAILHICPDLKGIGDEIRPGIVHRLDKDTSGLIVVAKTEVSLKHLSDQMKNRTVQKEYVALVKGTMPKLAGTVNLPIGRHPKNRKKMTVIENGREAVTEFKVIETRSDMSLLKLKLHTGRTHQIRVHLSHMGCKIIGDALYGAVTPLIDRQFLHAYRLQFVHPYLDITKTFTANLPDELAKLVKELGFDLDKLTSEFNE